MAMAYKLRFKKDVIVDFICYRKSGHNEMDEPAFTQPIMYQVIRGKTPIPKMYAQRLVVSDSCCFRSFFIIVYGLIVST